MKPIFLTVILIFLINMYIVYKYYYNYYRKNTKEKMWKLWGMKTMYWEGVVIVSSGLTVIVSILLKLIF
jgi:hypothetical protein